MRSGPGSQKDKSLLPCAEGVQASTSPCAPFQTVFRPGEIFKVNLRLNEVQLASTLVGVRSSDPPPTVIGEN